MRLPLPPSCRLQSKSFYRPARENELSDVDEESSSYGSGDEPAWEDAVESPSRLPRHTPSPPRRGRPGEHSPSPSPLQLRLQQQPQQQHDEEWGHGELYEPPVAVFTASPAGAAAGHGEPAAGAAAMGAAAAGQPPPAAGAAGALPHHHAHAHPAHLSHQGSSSSGGGGARFSHQGSGASGGRRSALSSLSVERTSIGSAGETAAAAAAAEALAAIEFERAETQRSWLGHAIEAAQAPVMLLLQVGC